MTADREDPAISITEVDIPLAKMLYLLNFSVESGQGGDKAKFWRSIMGFSKPEELRQHLLSLVTVEQLEKTGQNSYGWRYSTVVELTGPSGATWRIRTGWIVLYGESVARFVTAFPD